MPLTSEQLHDQFFRTRATSALLTRELSTEDQILQSMPDASPTKWHLAHTTWFFDTFILQPRGADVANDTTFRYLFNSYYSQVGPQYLRAHRGLLSRPSLQQVWDYRHRLDEKLAAIWQELTPGELVLIELGTHHEQQHQELIVTDIKHALSFNPECPALVKPLIANNFAAQPLKWLAITGGEYLIGSESGFCFDNEKPRHQYWIKEFRLAQRPVTNGEYLEFIDAGGYRDPRHWLSEGWAWLKSTDAQAPMYWRQVDSAWFVYTLAGELPLNLREPACHLNYFEANAFASWCGKRLPTEFEWEAAAQSVGLDGHFLDTGVLHPRCAPNAGSDQPLQLHGDVWEWTQSAYLPYPGFKTTAGAVGEYNGKFMVNQWVLRGGSCATPAGHIRATYRNFFPVNASWQFSGVRLADDVY